MQTIYLDQIHPLYYSFLSLPFKQFLTDFIVLFSYILMKGFDHIQSLPFTIFNPGVDFLIVDF
jgi:hypothetical protein